MNVQWLKKTKQRFDLWRDSINRCCETLKQYPLYWGRNPRCLTGPGIIIFPYSPNQLCCGLAGLISVHHKPRITPLNQLDTIETLIQKAQDKPLGNSAQKPSHLEKDYLGGYQGLAQLYDAVCALKRDEAFVILFGDKQLREKLQRLHQHLLTLCSRETKALQNLTGHLTQTAFETADRSLEKLKDITWCVGTEILSNLEKIESLLSDRTKPFPSHTVKIFRQINTVLNSIDRLEVRGRDSAGISLLFMLDTATQADLNQALEQQELKETFEQRTNLEILADSSINTHHHPQSDLTGITFVYKVAAEIGSLGDNVRRLRKAIAQDTLLHLVAQRPHRFQTVSAHTKIIWIKRLKMPKWR